MRNLPPAVSAVFGPVESATAFKLIEFRFEFEAHLRLLSGKILKTAVAPSSAKNGETGGEGWIVSAP